MVDRVIQLQPLVRRFGVPALVGMILLALFLDVVLRPEPIGVDFHTYAAASLVGMQTGWAYWPPLSQRFGGPPTTAAGRG